MGFAELLLIAIGLSMDAFAVAVGKGLGMQRLDLRHALLIALFFGGFQALMPIIGWTLGSSFSHYVEAIDHWIAFVLLVLIGANMIREARADAPDASDTQRTESEDPADNAASVTRTATDASVGVAASASAVARKLTFDVRELLLLAIATSIDALAIGVTFSFLQVDILPAATFIGAVTFVFSLGGVAAGQRFGTRWRKLSAIAGGIILIGIGVKILIEHLVF